jgi:hypothetical protein
VKYRIDMDQRNLLVPGNHMGGTSNQCYFAIFESKEIEQDQWYFGNILMEDYYIVYDSTPADERGEDFVQLGIAKSIDVLVYEEGAQVNVDEVIEIDNPIPDGYIPAGGKTDDESE